MNDIHGGGENKDQIHYMLLLLPCCWLLVPFYQNAYMHTCVFRRRRHIQTSNLFNRVVNSKNCPLFIHSFARLLFPVCLIFSFIHSFYWVMGWCGKTKYSLVFGLFSFDR